MPAIKLPDWLRELLLFGQAPERDRLEGIVDGDPDHQFRGRRSKGAGTIKLTLVLEFERGKGAKLTSCRVTKNEYRRFFNELESVRDDHPDATVFLYPAPINGVPQERIGVPFDRLVRVYRADGMNVFYKQRLGDADRDEHF